jgi:hypothetical protein
MRIRKLACNIKYYFFAGGGLLFKLNKNYLILCVSHLMETPAVFSHHKLYILELTVPATSHKALAHLM